jgi:hypothetical protein
MRSWELSEAQRQAARLRRDVQILDEAVARLETMLEEAHAFDAAHRERRQEILANMMAIRSKRWPLRSDERGYPVSGPPPAEMARFQDLERRLHQLDADHEREASDRMIHTYDLGGVDTSWSLLQPASVALRLQHVRITRDVAAGKLAEIEAGLSLGERIQAGAPAPDAIAHRERLAAIRERHGLTAETLP